MGKRKKRRYTYSNDMDSEPTTEKNEMNPVGFKAALLRADATIEEKQIKHNPNNQKHSIMHTQEEIQQKKKEFLNKYNQDGTEEWAIKSGINAAVRKARVYSDDLGGYSKEQIHTYWGEKLRELGGKYKYPQDEDTFRRDIEELVDFMNKQFPHAFDFPNRPNNIPAGFRIAQAQKSLSVYLKHMWCMNAVDTPPICPIDRVILGRTWIYINTMDEYNAALEEVKLRNNTDDELAVWELFAFNGYDENNEDDESGKNTKNKNVADNVEWKAFEPFKSLAPTGRFGGAELIEGYCIPLDNEQFRIFVVYENGQYYCEICYKWMRAEDWGGENRWSEYPEALKIFKKFNYKGNWINQGRTTKSYKYVRFETDRAGAVEFMHKIKEEIKSWK